MVASTTRSRLRRCLNEVDFPASKADLLHAADHNGFDDETAYALGAIPPETYTNLGQVLASVTIADDQGIGDAEKVAARRSHTKPGLAETGTDIGPQSATVEELGENRGPDGSDGRLQNRPASGHSNPRSRNVTRDPSGRACLTAAATP